eukprot:CAMPEP_0172299206 /NCGR_PEP_ID=MMETSP1058-20130122/1565_1 /TAXON_ID=83371 /ORGANISM="Detonula confervacea, Strain CCMP 353" /LENGTH=769 /DNA_ID=CAMNT_0013008567 /DNA_START=78 /DNA_END=2387 /DNA_ORIENTATION=-
MTKFNSALAVATVALSPCTTTALSLFPQRHRASTGPAHISGARVTRAASNMSNTRRPISFLSRRSKFLPFQAIAEAKEEEAFFADDISNEANATNVEKGSDEEDGKSWPVKPSPPDTPPPEKVKPPTPPAPSLPYDLPSAPTPPDTTIADTLKFLKPILNPTIAKNVPRAVIFGAFLNGAFLSLLSSFLLFGPFSILFSSLKTLILAASVGILTAYFSIIEGSVGDFLRGVGRATMTVGGGILGQVEVWSGENYVDKVANALLEKPKISRALKKKREKEEEETVKVVKVKGGSTILMKEGMTGEEAAQVRKARLDAADETVKCRELKKASAPVAEAPVSVVVPSVDYDAAARLAYQASSSDGDFEAFKAKYLVETSAMIAKKHQDAMAADNEAAAKVAEEKRQEEESKLKAEEEARATEMAAQLKAEEEEAQAKAEEGAKLKAEEEEAKAEEEAQLKAGAEEARATDMAAQLKVEEEEARAWNAAQLQAKEEEKSRMVMMAARLKDEEAARVAEEQARLQAEEEARAAEQAQLKQAEEEARAAEEQAQLKAQEEARAQAAAEEEQFLSEMRQIAAEEEEEQRQLEEQAVAAREAVRLMEEQEALMDDDDVDDDELDDEDWEASVRLANELQGGMPAPTSNNNIKGDVMDDIGDEMLQYEIDNLSQEEEDALGKAAREAVRKYEEDMMMKQSEKQGVRSAWDAEMVQPPAPAAAFEEEAFTASEETAPAPEAAGDYSKMTVAELKDILRGKGLKVGGKKAVLIERLEDSS